MLCPLQNRPLRPRPSTPLGERASLASQASLPIRGSGFAPTRPRSFQLWPNLRARVAKLPPTCQIPVAASLSCKARGLERLLHVRVDAKMSKRDSWKPVQFKPQGLIFIRTQPRPPANTRSTAAGQAAAPNPPWGPLQPPTP